MTETETTDRVRRGLDAAIERRLGADAAFFAEHAPRIASLCHAMAERFARGGRLVAVGSSAMCATWRSSSCIR